MGGFIWLIEANNSTCLLFILVLMPLTQGSVTSQVLGFRKRQPAGQTGGASRVEGIIKQIARNQLCSLCPGLERDVGCLQLQLPGQFPSTCWVPSLGGAEGRIESKSQVMTSRPCWRRKRLSRVWPASFWAREGRSWLQGSRGWKILP